MSVPGTSLLVDLNNDLVLSAVTNGGRGFTYVSGTQELQQSLRLRLETKLGEDVFDATFGLPMRRMMSVGTPEYAEGRISEAMLKDPRVIQASAVITSSNPLTRVMRISANAVASDATQVSVNATPR